VACCCPGTRRPPGLAGCPMTPEPSEYAEEAVIVDSVRAIRRRRISARKIQEPYLHIPMTCVTTLAQAGSPRWHGRWRWPLFSITWSPEGRRLFPAAFASRVGVEGRAARRHAIDALAASGLFHVQRDGKQATKVLPASRLKTLSRASTRA
jgi:hypothetical protein